MKKAKKKFENNWKHKSLESLEKENWGDIPNDESYLVTTCHKLRKKQLKDFDVEDLRIMIGQNIGIKYLIPLAFEVLKENILAEGDFYTGDLLSSVLTSDINYWKTETENWNQLCQLFNDNIDEIKEEAETYSTGKKILKAFESFVKINNI